MNDKVLLRCCRVFLAHDDNLDRIAFHLIGKETRLKKKGGQKRAGWKIRSRRHVYTDNVPQVDAFRVRWKPVAFALSSNQNIEQ